MEVASLTSKSFASLPFEQMLTMVFPRNLLDMPQEEYSRGKFLNQFIPPPLPYRGDIVTSFTDKFADDLLTRYNGDLLVTLDIVLHVILSKGRLMLALREELDENNDPVEEIVTAFLWMEKDGWYTTFTYTPGEGIVRDVTQNLDQALIPIFNNYFTGIVEASYDTIEPEIKIVLDFMAIIREKEVDYLRKELETDGYYQISNEGGMVLSFRPLILYEDGYIILTEHGLFIYGDLDGHVDYSAYRLKDIDPILASETYNRYISS